MKILNVNMSLDPKDGGTSERTVQMTRHLLKTGQDVRVLTTDKGLTSERVEPFADRLIVLPCLWKRFYVPRPDLRRVREAVAWADVVHLMGHWTLLNAWVYEEARRQGKDFVFCPAGALPIFGRSRILKLAYNKAFGHGMVKGASAQIAVTRAEIPDFIRYGADREKIKVIPNAIDPAHYDDSDARAFRELHGLDESPFVLFLGRLSEIKGPDLLLKAFADIQDRISAYHLVFAGPDEGMQKTLKFAAEQSGLGYRVHFTGHLDRAQKSRALHAATMLAIPSRQEAMSIVALEAGIVGKPVLVTDQCGFDEVAEVGGGVVVPATSEGIAQGLLSLLVQQPEERLMQMGASLERFCREKFTWSAVVQQYLDLYRDILSVKDRRG